MQVHLQRQVPARVIAYPLYAQSPFYSLGPSVWPGVHYSAWKSAYRRCCHVCDDNHNNAGCTCDAGGMEPAPGHRGTIPACVSSNGGHVPVSNTGKDPIWR